MKTWLNSGAFWIFVLVAALAPSACSEHARKFNSDGGAAGELATSAGASGKAGGAGRAGAGGAPSSAEGGMGGDGSGDMAGVGGDPGTIVGCAGLTCAAEASCTGTDADAHCVCPTGYTDPRSDGTLCQDIDECTNLNGGCDALVACTNTPGSSTCAGCPAGYTGAPATGCVDIDECASNNGGCDKAVKCTNTPGARVCGNCPFGYNGTGESGCADIDECAANNGGCDTTVTCKNTPGGYTCGNCPSGYNGGGATGCVDVDECATNNGGCDSHVKCTNAPGSFSCGGCPLGYNGTGSTGCVDINECASNNGGCSGNATCSNTAGSYSCACKGGYTGDGVTCTDVNECMTNNGGCNANASCTNTIGSKTCACNTGFSGDGATCTDVNECLTNNGGCSANASCTNTTGSKTCACNTGFSGNGVTCTDVNECATNNGGCSANATCTNTTGSKTCACKSGFAGDGITCNAPGTGCKWNCAGTNCVQVALDNDSDGHGTTACAAAPGDDCDDTQGAIFPGATELCDGIDNDCDKKLDMSDGLPLVGATQNMARLNHAAVAAVNDGTFGVVGTSASEGGLIYGSISTTGVGSVSAGTIFSPTATTTYLDPHLAWGVELGNFGVAYAKNGIGGLNGNAGLMAFTSCCWVDVISPGKGDVTARGQGDLLFAGATSGNLGFTTQTRSGTPLTVNVPISGTWDSYNPQVASNGTSSGVIWQLFSPKTLNWALLSATLASGATEQLSTSALYADLETISAGYGLAWIEGVGFRFMIKKANGATQCTSSVIPFGTGPQNQQLAVSDSANGNVVVATSPDSNLIHLYRFDNACKLMDDADVSTSSSAPTEPRVVRGGGHVVVYWTDNSGGHYRFLSDQLCH